MEQDPSSFDTLEKIVARLRAPDGCSWDRAQSHASLKPYLIEEAYEVIQALDEELCTGCEICVDWCPFGAIEMIKTKGSKKEKAFVDTGKCMGCGICVLKCDFQALSLKLVRPPEHIPQAL